MSVLLTNYNYSSFLDEALRSVLAQSYGRFELIAVDDGSTDGSVERLTSWGARDPRIEVLIRPNRGVGVSINEAFDRSKGGIVCLLDSDDVYLPKKLERLVEAFRSDEVGYVHHGMTKIGVDGTVGHPMPRFGTLDRGILAATAWRQGGRWRRAVSSGIALRREVAERIMPVPEGSTRSADGYLCMVVPFVTRVGAVDEALSLYRIHEANLAGRSDLDTARIRMQHIVDTVGAANERLAELHIGRPIQVARSLSYHEQELLLCALDGGGYGEILRRYGRFARELLGDRLFTPMEKAALAGLYGVMAVVPPRLRATWSRWARAESI